MVTALTENRGNKTYQSRLIRWADIMLPFKYTTSHLAGSKIGIADYLSRSPKFEALLFSNYTEQFIVKAIESFDEENRMIYTPQKNLLDHGKVQLIHAHKKRTVYTQINFLFDVNLRKRLKSVMRTLEEDDNILYKNFNQSNHWYRTANLEATFDKDGPSPIQSTHPQEGTLSCDFYLSNLDYLKQILIPHVHIGNLRGEFFSQSKQYNQICNSPRNG